MVRKPLATLEENLIEIENLLTIHEHISGTGPGRRHPAFETLNKSGVVLLVACWEAFVEDLADKAFSSLLRNARTPQTFPENVKKLIAKSLKDDKHELRVLELAGSGWKTIFQDHQAITIEKHIRNFHTPSAEKIDKLFSELVGLGKLSKCWSWTKMKPAGARKRLSKLIRLRNDIAHRVRARSGTVRKGIVKEHLEFLRRLARLSSDRVNKHLSAANARQV